MLSDEERKAIEIVKSISEDDLLNYWEGPEEPYNAIQTILNLIEKQSKEIEELKEDNKHQWEERCKLTFKLENSTPNDKIKAKIEDLKENSNGDDFNLTNVIMILQSLLEKE